MENLSVASFHVWWKRFMRHKQLPDSTTITVELLKEMVAWMEKEEIQIHSS